MLLQLEVIKNNRIAYRHQIGLCTIPAQFEHGRPAAVLCIWDQDRETFKYYLKKDNPIAKYIVTEILFNMDRDNVLGYHHAVDVVMHHVMRQIYYKPELEVCDKKTTCHHYW